MKAHKNNSAVSEILRYTQTYKHYCDYMQLVIHPFTAKKCLKILNITIHNLINTQRYPKNKQTYKMNSRVSSQLVKWEEDI